MSNEWEALEGVSLAGEYGLQQWLGSDPTGAFFSTSVGPEGQRAVVKITAEDESAGSLRLSWWQQTALLSHPNLLPLLDCGRTDYAGESLLYAVFEAPEDSLSAALQNGPLSEAEGREVFSSALDALQYIHERGWVHGAI